MASCDFTFDMNIGFDNEVLYNQMNKVYKNCDRQSQYCMKAKVNTDPNPNEHYEICIQNKLAYYMMVKNLKDRIGFQLNGLYNNHNEYVQK